MRYLSLSSTALLLMSLFVTPAAICQDQDKNAESTSNGLMVIRQSSDDGDSSFENVQVMSFDSTGGGSFTMNTGGMALPMMGGDQFNMLNNESVQKDLELVGDQLSQIQAINKDFGKQIREQMGSFKTGGGGFDMERIKGLSSMIRDLKAQQKDEINNILLPHQQDRLKQVALQMKMKSMGTAKALSSKLADELGLTAEQKKKLKQRNKEIQEEIRRKTAELKSKARESLLDVLTAEQRKKLEAMTGKKFESPAMDRATQMQFGPRRFNRKSSPKSKK